MECGELCLPANEEKGRGTLKTLTLRFVCHFTCWSTGVGFGIHIAPFSHNDRMAARNE